MRVHLRPRLERAADMLGQANVAADIGSDHGRLAVSLLQQGRAERVIAADISAPSLQKARTLAIQCGVEGRVDFRVANGLAALEPGEADAILMAGMGGVLIARMLKEGEAVARAAKRLVLQPQGSVSDLRAFLYENGYSIEEEAIVLDAGRYYQLLRVQSGPPRPLPPGWPPGYLELGPVAYESGEPLLLPLAQKFRAGHLKRLRKAERDGHAPALLLDALASLDAIIARLEDRI